MVDALERELGWLSCMSQRVVFVVPSTYNCIMDFANLNLARYCIPDHVIDQYSFTVIALLLAFVVVQNSDSIIVST